ncbi:MAG: tRNA (guanosine(37)-N1)-methyltransferase TrmD [bacterium]|nr:tRNA (guanosine(37)-N1)-methyltransferase TrmD [bacterium]
MRFDIITIFPHLLDSYTNESLLKRAQKNNLLSINTHDLRAHTNDPHNKVDDTPYGGGPGMVYQVEPVVQALEALPRDKKSTVILTSPRGTPFSQKMAKQLSKYDQLIFVCPRYEGIDERIKKYIDKEISIGPYVLNGGEIAAMVVIEAVSRYIPGVLGKEESLVEESFSQEGVLEYPQYTRPETFRGSWVPKILLSGNHKKIAEWRAKKSPKGAT